MFRQQFVRFVPHLLVLTVFLMVGSPTLASAASVEFTPTQKTSFDKMVASADATNKTKLKSQYDELLTLQTQEQSWESKIKSIHYSNEETLLVIQQRLKLVDAAKISDFEEQITKAKNRYQPLFTLHTTMTQQHTVVKSAKNKSLATALQIQIDLMKIPVQLAKQEIKTKEGLLKAAKDSRNSTVKQIRGTLSEMDIIKVKMKGEKTAISERNKKIAAEWKTFTPIIKKGDASSSLTAMASLSAHMRQLIAYKQNLYKLEQKNEEILNKVLKST